MIYCLTDGKAVLADLVESIAAIKALGTEVLRPHPDVQGRSALRLEPFESDIHETRAETQIVMSREHIELLNLSGNRFAMLDGQLARTDHDETDRCRTRKLGDPNGALMPDASRINPDSPKVRCQSLTMNASTKAISPKSKKSSMSPIVAAKAIFHWFAVSLS